MTAFVDPSTVHNPAVGAIAPAAWGDTVNADLNGLENAPSCRVYNSAIISPSNGLDTILTFNSERWDNDNIHDVAAPARLTCQTAGVYHIYGSIKWASNSTGIRRLQIILNNLTPVAGTDKEPGTGLLQSVSTEYKLGVGDYMELWATQFSGASLDIAVSAHNSPEFGMTRVSAG